MSKQASKQAGQQDLVGSGLGNRNNLEEMRQRATAEAVRTGVEIALVYDPIANAEEAGDWSYCPLGKPVDLLFRHGKIVSIHNADGHWRMEEVGCRCGYVGEVDCFGDCPNCRGGDPDPMSEEAQSEPGGSGLGNRYEWVDLEGKAGWLAGDCATCGRTFLHGQVVLRDRRSGKLYCGERCCEAAQAYPGGRWK